MRIYGALICVLSLGAVVAQFNDPDPLLWIALYGVCGALGAAAALGKTFPRITMVAIAVYFAGFLYLSPALSQATLESFTSRTMNSLADEEAREAMGLLLSALLLGGLLLARRKRALVS
jgi:hypothetical protein